MWTVWSVLFRAERYVRTYICAVLDAHVCARSPARASFPCINLRLDAHRMCSCVGYCANIRV